MVRLTRLKIDRFRNVKPGTDLRFGPTFNVLLGKNATGKSTLLDLIAAVTSDTLSNFANEDGGFDLTWWLEDREAQVEQRAVRTLLPSQAVVGTDANENIEAETAWTIVLRTEGAETCRVGVTGTRGTAVIDSAKKLSFEVPHGIKGDGVGVNALMALRGELSAQDPLIQPISAGVRLLSGTEGMGRFDEALTSLDLITRSRFELSHDRFRGKLLFPHAVVNQLMRSGARDPLIVSFKSLDSLAEIPPLLGFVGAELRPRVLQKSRNGKVSTTIYDGFDCLFQRADGSQISHQLLSFGQKRLLAFLWYLAVRRSLPVIADELLNGLHHEWIEICLARLRDRQSFLATHDPLLLDHIPIESAAAVQTTFVRCSLETDADGHEQMAWRNFTDEESDRFFIAYQTGIQHVSEVLRSEGLW